MAEPSRYSVGGKEDGQEVLQNMFGISDLKNLEDVETLLYSDSYNYFLERLRKGDLKFTIKLIFEIHKYFLGKLYSWAGKARTVEISKGGTLFCVSLQISNELEKLDKLLANNLPVFKDSKKKVSHNLAVIHCEFNAIHPFREGNGRTVRLFLDLLALNAGFNMIDYSKISPDTYIKAGIAGMRQDYAKMEKLIYRGLSK